MRITKFRCFDLDKKIMIQDVSHVQRDGIVVMQFTGLLDKLGKEIYEGDIVKHHLKDHEWSGNHEVLFHDGRFMIKGGCPHGLRGDGAFNWYPMNVEIIGNIWQNPDLLHKESHKEDNKSSRKGKRNGERKEWAEKLCLIMGWPETEMWKISNQVLGIDKTKSICEKFGQPIQIQDGGMIGL